MENRIERAFLDIFERVENLNEGEVLHTSFGPENYYVIDKHEEGIFSFIGYRNKHSFQKEGSIDHIFSFRNVEELRRGILKRPEMYAKGVYSREVSQVHMDNWINLINGFKLKSLVHHVDYNMYSYDLI